MGVPWVGHEEEHKGWFVSEWWHCFFFFAFCVQKFRSLQKVLALRHKQCGIVFVLKIELLNHNATKDAFVPLCPNVLKHVVVVRCINAATNVLVPSSTIVVQDIAGALLSNVLGDITISPPTNALRVVAVPTWICRPEDSILPQLTNALEDTAVRVDYQASTDQGCPMSSFR